MRLLLNKLILLSGEKKQTHRINMVLFIACCLPIKIFFIYICTCVKSMYVLNDDVCDILNKAIIIYLMYEPRHVISNNVAF